LLLGGIPHAVVFTEARHQQLGQSGPCPERVAPVSSERRVELDIDLQLLLFRA
jgi:hypothetical protein